MKRIGTEARRDCSLFCCLSSLQVISPRLKSKKINQYPNCEPKIQMLTQTGQLTEFCHESGQLRDGIRTQSRAAAASTIQPLQPTETETGGNAPSLSPAPCRVGCLWEPSRYLSDSLFPLQRLGTAQVLLTARRKLRPLLLDVINLLRHCGTFMSR